MSTITALDYVNERENVVIRFAHAGNPMGETVAWNPPETDLPFDLADVEGEIGDDGGFRATNLNDGSGLRGWRFHDGRGNSLVSIWLDVNEKVWRALYDEWYHGE